MPIDRNWSNTPTMSKLVFRLGEESLPNVISDKDQDLSPFADILRSAKEKVNN